jgi:hypothetical protein
MSKHTPGPWKVVTDIVESTPFEVHTADGIRWTARCVYRADADLISAAPDYDKAARDLLELWPLSGYELEAYCDATLIPALRAAIRKAEGA